MGWFKRNLFFAIGILLALGLLGAAGFYDYKSWQSNAAAYVHLTEQYNALKNNTVSDGHGHSISPGNDKVDNIAAAREQEKQLRDWIRQAQAYFEPITPVPNPADGPLSNESFANALHKTIDQLQREAATANVQLPPQYQFSFTAQSGRVQFTGGVQQLAQQLGEVKTISELLFAARINALEDIQRVPVSDDDASGPPTDYLMSDRPVTGDLAVLTPYQVTFRGFSPEIAKVLAVFAAPPHGFIVKTIAVQPASAPAPDYYGSVPPPPAAITLPGKGGMQVVLNEQMLRVSVVVEVVKLTPRN